MVRERIILTEYDDAVLAQRHADFLQRKGIDCDVRMPSLADQFVANEFYEGDVWLMVAEEQAEAAIEWLEAIEQTPLAYPAGPSETYMLVGGLIAFVGMLVMLGNSAFMMEPEVRFIPWTLTAIGSAIFARGIWYGRAG